MERVLIVQTYEELKAERNKLTRAGGTDNEWINDSHDEIIRRAFDAARNNVEREQGPPPAPFAFFVMGSAGRAEQTALSDQDHGILFEGEEHQEYFLALGKEVSRGLDIIGYELCDGNVMASNPLWCKTVESSRQQVRDWLREESWQSLRYFLIFFDGRVLVGEEKFLQEVKLTALDLIEQEHLHHRLRDNVDFIKKGIGAFGQLLPDTRESGDLEIKRTVYFPFVNAVRLLAVKGRATCAPTLERMTSLETRYPFLDSYREDFKTLLSLRLQREALVPIEQLSKEEKKEWKRLIRRGRKLFREASRIMEEGGRT